MHKTTLTLLLCCLFYTSYAQLPKCEETLDIITGSEDFLVFSCGTTYHVTGLDSTYKFSLESKTGLGVEKRKNLLLSSRTIWPHHGLPFHLWSLHRMDGTMLLDLNNFYVDVIDSNQIISINDDYQWQVSDTLGNTQNLPEAIMGWSVYLQQYLVCVNCSREEDTYLITYSKDSRIGIVDGYDQIIPISKNKYRKILIVNTQPLEFKRSEIFIKPKPSDWKGKAKRQSQKLKSYVDKSKAVSLKEFTSPEE